MPCCCACNTGGYVPRSYRLCRMHQVPAWLKALLTPRELSAVERQAVALIEAIDAGGLPLNPARVNDIGRRLGLEVLVTAPMPETLERIRAELRQRGLAN